MHPDPRNGLPDPALFRKLVDAMQIGVIVADADGTVVYMNDTYARFLGIDPAEQIGRHATEVVANTRLHVVARTGVAEINQPHWFRDTGFLVHRVPIREQDRVVAVLGLVLFDSASTASSLGKKVSQLQSKLEVYEDQLAALRENQHTFDRIAGVSEAICGAKAEAQQAATTDLPVLLTGESGTGKEIFAQAIHNASARRLFPLIRVNCAAIPRELFEAELFGYERGSFTGANPAGRAGKFELADHGTIFLDEIGDLPRELQPKLLRVLDMREFERVGAHRVIRSDFRLIAATNRDLEEMVREGRFRRDLYFRLNVVPIHLAALRDRPEDVAPLAQRFLEQIIDLGGFPPSRLGAAALTCLRNYPWPGNGRELMHVLERTLATHPGGTITPAEFPYHVRQRGAGAGSVRPGGGLRAALQEAERQILADALEQAAGNRSRAARALGIHRTALYRKMHSLGMAPGAP